MLYTYLKETDLLPDLFSEKQSTFIEQFKSNNVKIYSAVEKILPLVFEKKLSNMETAFVTLHFVVTLERNDLVLPIQAALVTNRGLISCELLMSSLRKNFPFLKNIELIQPSSNFDMGKYDVTFITEKNLDYIYVNRILEQKNLDDVRHKLRYSQ